MKWDGPFILRLFFGVAFIIAGLDKLFSFPMAKGMFGTFFGSAGTLMLILAIIIELVGGITLLIGYRTRIAASMLAVLILVALVTTFKLGEAPHFIGSLREIMVMNTGGGNTAVNFAYLGALISLMVSGSKNNAIKPD